MKKARNIAVNPRLAPTGAGTLARAIADYGLPDACEIIYHGRNVVALLDNAGLVIKAFRHPGVIRGWIYRWFRVPKSRRSYSNAMRLRELGINTPEPAFAIECYRRNGALGSSYYACSALNGWTELRGAEKRPDFPALAAALAEFIFDIHCKSVLMEDMTPGNILFCKEGDNFRFALVDINRMRFDVDGWAPLLENFRALLDTEEGTVAVAREYARILKANNIHPDTDDFVEAARATYSDFQRKLLRRRRFKNFFRHRKK